MAIEPTFEGFIQSVKLDSYVVLNLEQQVLAASLIGYRRAHFMMGARTGRTTVVDLVQAYFKDCEFPKAGREI
jgi:hypothetical protein